MGKPTLLKNLESMTAKKFKRTRGISVDVTKAPYIPEQIRHMTEVYGNYAVLEDFEKWIEETQGQEFKYPLSEYLKIVDARLGTKMPEDQEQVAKITKVVYDTLNDIPTPNQIRHLLEKYPVEDIVEAFGQFVGGIDEKMKGSDIIKKFFSDGGAEAVLSSLYDNK